MTNLLEASEQGDLCKVVALLAGGADVKAVDGYSNTPLHLASRRGHDKLVEVLLAYGADINAKNNLNFTPLHSACFNEHENAETLRASVAGINTISENTPVHLASEERYVNTVKVLLAHGADINMKADYFTTPLYFASKSGHKDLIKLLVSSGADVHATDSIGNTSHAQCNGVEPEISLLLTLALLISNILTT